MLATRLDMAEQRSPELLSRRPKVLCTHHDSTLRHCPNKYIYNPLADSARWIRLLSLYPANDDNVDAPLHACLWPVPRSEAPMFKPVSYTWGQEEATSCIWVEGVEGVDAAEPGSAVLRCIPIRPNLERLLKQFRRENDGVPLWVDALCINQEDHHEKGFQVRHMDEVYRARQVLIWLGDRSETSDVAIDFIEDWKPFQREKKFSAGSDFINNTVMPQQWSALWDLIGRPWFSRRWIVQECVLSDHKHVYIGDRHFCWEYLISLVLLMESTNHDAGLRKTSNVCSDLVGHCSNGPTREASHYVPDSPDRIESLKSLQRAYSIFHSAEAANLTLEKLVDDFCGFFSQDPRDGIYAFLSLATDTTDSEWVPDYSPENSATHVYAQATRHIIRQTGSLDIICRSNPQYNDHHHSWIPWFGPSVITLQDGHSHTVHGYKKKSLTTFGQPLGSTRRLRRCCHAVCDGCDAPIRGVRHKCERCRDFDFCDGCVKHASTSHEADHSFRRIPPKFGVYNTSAGTRINIGSEAELSGLPLTEGRHMTLDARGWFVDTVSQVGSWIKTSHESDGVSFVVDWSILRDTDAVKAGRLSDGFFRAITGNRRVEIVQGADVMEEQISCVPKAWLQAVKDVCQTESVLPGSDFQEQILTSMLVMASGPRWFAMTGKSMGFVPAGTEPGDAVCILAGCTVPVVLRKRTCESDQDWFLVGECYIEGLMEGEFMREMEANDKFVEPSHISLQ